MNPAMKPVFFVLAALYLAVDEIFASIATPIANWLSGLRMYAREPNWIYTLSPYQSLALFLVPVLVLEPLKLVGTYLFATGRFMEAALVLAIGVTLKLVLIERLFDLTRNKLMTIPAFVWCYVRVLDWLEALPALQVVKAKMRTMKLVLREFIRQTFYDQPAAPKRSEVRERQRDRRMTR
jgi:hypothetical protein